MTIAARIYREIRQKRAPSFTLVPGGDRVGRRRQYDTNRVTTAVRIPAELHEQLQCEAEARDVSVNYLIVRGIKLALERLTPLGITEQQLDERAS